MRTFVAALGLSVGCRRPIVWKPVAVAKPPAPTSIEERTTVPRGAMVVARLDQAVGTDLSVAGQPYTATTVTPILDRAGHTIVPAGVRLEGHVASVVRGQGVTPARLVLAVDRLATLDAKRSVRARVSAMEELPVASAPSHEPVSRGAVGGAFVGAVLMGIPGAWLGAGVGWSGGIASSIGKRVLEVRLPAGSLVTIRFDAPVTVA